MIIHFQSLEMCFVHDDEMQGGGRFAVEMQVGRRFDCTDAIEMQVGGRFDCTGAVEMQFGRRFDCTGAVEMQVGGRFAAKAAGS